MIRFLPALCLLLVLTTLFPARALSETEWSGILAKAEAALDAKSAAVSRLEQDLPPQIDSLRTECLSLTTRMELMLWSHKTDYDNPLDLDDVIHSLADADARVKGLVRPFRDVESSLTMHAEDLAAEVRRMRGSEDWIRERLPEKDAGRLKAMYAQASSLAKRINVLRSTLSNGLQHVGALHGRLRDLLRFFDTYYFPALRTFYLQPSPGLLTAPGRASLLSGMRQWLERLRIRSMDSSPKNMTDWIILFALTLGAALAIMKGVEWGLNTLDRLDRQTFFGKKTATRAGAWTGAGIALFAAVSTMQVSPSAFFRALAVILLARGMLLLSESLNNAKTGQTRSYLLLNAWRVLAAGNLLQGLLMPEEALSLVMAAGLAFCAAAYFVRAREESGLEKAVCFALAWPWTGLAVMALFGWGNLAVNTADFLFALYLSLLVGIRLTTALKLSDASGTDSDASQHKAKADSVARGVCLAFSFPLLLLLLGACVLFITLGPLGGFSMFQALLEMRFGLGDGSLTVARLLGIIGLFFLTRSTVVFTRDYIMGKTRTEEISDGAAGSLQILVSYAIWATYGLLALYLTGIPLDNLTMVGGGLSVGIGFGMKNVVNNFLSGLILLFSRSVQPGDVVNAAGEMGFVQHVTIRNTEVKTFSGTTVFIPNSELVSKPFVNWSHKDPQFRMSLNVTVDYDADPETVTKLLLALMQDQPDILKNPAPQVRFQDFGNVGLDFETRFWVPNTSAMSVASELRYAINKTFKEHHIRIPFPSYDVRMQRMPGEGEGIVK